jgi:hypothetical protein
MVELYSKDDIVIFSDDTVMFGEAANVRNINNRSSWDRSNPSYVVKYITPTDEEYWDYFFDVEE